MTLLLITVTHIGTLTDTCASIPKIKTHKFSKFEKNNLVSRVAALAVHLPLRAMEHFDMSTQHVINTSVSKMDFKLFWTCPTQITR